MLELQVPSPIQSLRLSSNAVQVHLKREDLIHTEFGGNKWRKLKYNLEEFKRGSYSHLITFGGAFSNHIAATAAVGNYYSIPTVGIIRGTYVDLGNVTLGKAQQNGMILHTVTREAYRSKLESSEIQALIGQYPSPFIIPEGGSNVLGSQGCQEILEEVRALGKSFDYVIVPAGTGMTASGLISASHHEKILVVNVLKNSGLENTIRKQVPTEKKNWEVLSNYHFGGYAKVNKILVEFINGFNKNHHIRLDPIYNGKALYAVEDLISKNYFPKDSRVLYVLTGGLQGIAAYNSRCKREEMKIG